MLAARPVTAFASALRCRGASVGGSLMRAAVVAARLVFVAAEAGLLAHEGRRRLRL
jgi:hypothetical protein